ncbi:hypothetical protein [Rufibacter psychrotolerans]|uniref:hypothetical protein n=1 Tax=Rufibacter psychrotolerans TaxID=2812556 RepID=UPI001F07C990|nr:hypothetical protein [Rufibacter sp. SYSU D00308]
MKGSGNSPKQNRPDQDRSWRDINSQDDNLNNSNRHNNNPPYDGSPETRSNPNTPGSGNQKSNDNNSKSTGAGVSGRPNSELSHSGNQGNNAPKYQEGPVPGGADNTRGENVPSREGHGGGAKKGKVDPEQHTPQGSHANPSDTRGADSSDKEFRNTQPNASTLKGHKDKEGLGNEKE